MSADLMHAVATLLAAAAAAGEPRQVIGEFLDLWFPDITEEKTRRRAVNTLQRMGYSYEDIRAVLRQRTEEDTDDD